MTAPITEGRSSAAMTALKLDQTLFPPIDRIEPLDVLPEQFGDQNIVGL